MGRVIAEVSVSLDGFMAGPNAAVGNAMGDGGERLHAWSAPSFRSEILPTSGAVVIGRRMFDGGQEHWGDDPPFHMPVFVVTHRAGAPLVMTGGTTYHFVTDGIQPALEQARAAAGEKDVALGGADIVQQFVAAGLVDELWINLVPVLLGDGTRLFERRAPKQIELQCTRVLEAPGVTHLRYRVLK